MGAVMIRCPRTKQAIPTGIMSSRAAFEATPVFFGRVTCPHCRVTHEWFAGDAWVDEPASLGDADAEFSSDDMQPA